MYGQQNIKLYEYVTHVDRRL